MDLSRREILVFGAGTVFAAVAGNATIPLPRPELTITAMNFDSAPHRLDIQFYRTDVAERSEAIVLNHEFELEKPSD